MERSERPSRSHNLHPLMLQAGNLLRWPSHQTFQTYQSTSLAWRAWIWLPSLGSSELLPLKPNQNANKINKVTSPAQKAIQAHLPSTSQALHHTHYVAASPFCPSGWSGRRSKFACSAHQNISSASRRLKPKSLATGKRVLREAMIGLWSGAVFFSSLWLGLWEIQEISLFRGRS